MLPGCTPWPAEEAGRYRRAGHWRGEPLGEALRRSAGDRGTSVALVDDTERLTYAGLDARVDRFARGLLELGLAPGDRVVVHLPNVTEFVVATYALLRTGVLPVYALPSHREQEIAYLCEFTEAAAYLIPDRHLGFDHRELARTVAARPGVKLRHVLCAGDAREFVAFADVEALGERDRPLPSVAAGDVALFLLSGGTTGRPKLIPRTHDDYAYNVRASADVCGFDSRTVYLAALPAAHNFALACPGVLGTLAAGGTVVLASDPSPAETLPLIAEEGVTATALVPSLVRLWLEAVSWLPEDLSSLRLLQVGGARLDPRTAARVRPELGCALQQVFGMAEGLLNYTRLDDPEDLVLGTQGRPLSPDDEIRVVDEDGRDVPAGATGQLLTRGPYTLRGYYRAPEHNARAFVEGWYRTGDLVRVLDSGHLVVEGRVTDVVNRAGDKIPVEEVEEHLAAHPAIREVAVTGEPDAVLGERTRAYVVAAPGAERPDLAGLGEYLRGLGLAAYKVPDRLCFIQSLPLTAIGKVDRKALSRAPSGSAP
ncbi:AMP-binding protein [Actinomadura sp. DC4]|uniref:(2,3-dihydroxybenzoyl)adenylate synthase n=1 Tax=Actinomadura sp. DC4 TaxID=3055069 RepID=UPI0025AEE63D|nr:AMP-binding protein [Actinomadura sp. DC4]MDN3356783.1 AMP-binding protein [Actinomadura sp. DC4]